ncbi:MAG: hypothetical protein IPG49_13445 [Proteobacteria bacterium]|nr:hypothetical protein [Pseudomonadota bacterium]
MSLGDFQHPRLVGSRSHGVEIRKGSFTPAGRESRCWVNSSVVTSVIGIRISIWLSLQIARTAERKPSGSDAGFG